MKHKIGPDLHDGSLHNIDQREIHFKSLRLLMNQVLFLDTSIH